MEKHPTYEIEVKKPEKPSKPKRTYKGMDIDFIRDYLTAIDDYVTLNLINDVVDYAEKMGLSKYPLAKRVLFEAYENFDYDDAKRKVDLFHHQQMLEKAAA